MQNMRNKLNYLKNTWTYNHKSLIVIASLLLALYYPAYIEPYMPTWPTVEATYTKQATTTPTAEVVAKTMDWRQSLKAIRRKLHHSVNLYARCRAC